MNDVSNRLGGTTETHSAPYCLRNWPVYQCDYLTCHRINSLWDIQHGKRHCTTDVYHCISEVYSTASSPVATIEMSSGSCHHNIPSTSQIQIQNILDQAQTLFLGIYQAWISFGSCMYFHYGTFFYNCAELVSQSQNGDDLTKFCENNHPPRNKISLMYVIFHGVMGTTYVIHTHQQLT